MKYNLDEVKAEPLVLTIGGKEYSIERMPTEKVLTLDRYAKLIQQEKTIKGQYEQSLKLARELAPSVPESVMRGLDMATFTRLSEVCTSYHYGEKVDAVRGSGSGNAEPAPAGGKK